jgi:hypothetical protein
LSNETTVTVKLDHDLGGAVADDEPKQPDATTASRATTTSENRLIAILDAERLVKVPTTPHVSQGFSLPDRDAQTLSLLTAWSRVVRAGGEFQSSLLELWRGA